MTLKSGILAGILALLLAFIAEIPLYPPENWALNFKIFSINNLEFYFWGYIIDGNIAFTSVGGTLSEVIISACIWFMIFYIGISSIFASSKEAKQYNSIKLFQINILLLSITLLIFGIIIFFIVLENLALFLTIIGFGYYFVIIILVLNILALKNLRKK